MERCFWIEKAQGGEFGIGKENASGNQGESDLALPGVTAIDKTSQTEFLDGTEDGGDVTVRQGGGDFELLVEWDVDTATGVRRRIWSGGFALEGGLEGVDGMSWALGEIGEGAFADFAVFPVARKSHREKTLGVANS